MIGVLLALLVLAIWTAADARWLLGRDRRSDALGRARRWPELRAHLLAVRFTKRPFACLARALLSPGLADAQLALGLHQIGLGEEALSYARRAVDRARRRPRLLAQVMPALVLVEDGLGHRAEARAALAELERVAGAESPRAAVGIVVDHHEGRLVEGLARAERILHAGPGADQARTGAALLHALRGDREAALAVLDHAPGDLAGLIDPKRLAALRRSAQARAALERLRERYRTGMRSARQVAIAVAQLQAEDPARALEALAALPAGAELPWAVEVIAGRARAYAHALASDAERADAALAELRAVARHPYRRRDHDTALTEAACAVLLGRAADARAALERSLRDAVHPIERHAAHYWGHAAARLDGRDDEARAHADALLADGIASWMRARVQASQARAESL